MNGDDIDRGVVWERNIQEREVFKREREGKKERKRTMKAKLSMQNALIV